MERYKKKYLIITLFLLPALLFYTAILVYPIFKSFYLSAFTWNGISGLNIRFVGFKNYYYIFTDPVFWGSVKNILYFMVINILVQIPVGLLLAILLASGIKFVRFFKAAFFMPIILSATSVSLMFRFIFYPDTGLLDVVLTKLHLQNLIHIWLSDPKISIFVVILVGCWQNLGVVMIIFLSGIVGIPDSVNESASLDGTNFFQRIIFITIPMIWDVMKVNIILLIIGTTKVFDIIYVMTSGGPNNSTDVMATLLYSEAFNNNKYGTASAIAVVIFLLGFSLTIAANKIMNRESLE